MIPGVKSQMNPFRTLPSSLFDFRFSIILRVSSIVCISRLAFPLSSPFDLNVLISIWRKVQILNSTLYRILEQPMSYSYKN
jgi:hypothetical protein